MVHKITAVTAELAAAVLGRGKGHRVIRWEKAWDSASSREERGGWAREALYTDHGCSGGERCPRCSHPQAGNHYEWYRLKRAGGLPECVGDYQAPHYRIAPGLEQWARRVLREWEAGADTRRKEEEAARVAWYEAEKAERAAKEAADDAERARRAALPPIGVGVRVRFNDEGTTGVVVARVPKTHFDPPGWEIRRDGDGSLVEVRDPYLWILETIRE